MEDEDESVTRADIEAMLAVAREDDDEEESGDEPDFELPPEIASVEPESPPKVVRVTDFRSVPKVAAQTEDAADDDADDEADQDAPAPAMASPTLESRPAVAMRAHATPGDSAEVARLQALVDRRERRIAELHDQLAATQAQLERMSRRLANAQGRTRSRAPGGRGSLWSAERYLAAATSGEWRLP